MHYDVFRPGSLCRLKLRSLGQLPASGDRVYNCTKHEPDEPCGHQLGPESLLGSRFGTSRGERGCHCSGAELNCFINVFTIIRIYRSIPDLRYFCISSCPSCCTLPLPPYRTYLRSLFVRGSMPIGVTPASELDKKEGKHTCCQSTEDRHSVGDGLARKPRLRTKAHLPDCHPQGRSHSTPLHRCEGSSLDRRGGLHCSKARCSL
jgi:hypothetical protein